MRRMIDRMIDEPVTLVVILVCAVGFGLLLAGPPARAQQAAASGGDAFAFDALTVTSATPVGLTSTKVLPSGQASAQAVYCTVETNSVRYRFDGAAAVTTTVGHLVASGGSVRVVGANNLRNLRFIASGGNAAVYCTLSQ